MSMSGTLRSLLLAGICLCVCGAPVLLLRSLNPSQDSSVTLGKSTHHADVKFVPSDAEHVTGLMLNVGAGGGTGPHGRPEGIDAVTQTENGDSSDRRSGLSEAVGEAWSQRSKAKTTGVRPEMGDSDLETASVLLVDAGGKKEEAPFDAEPTGGRKQPDTDMSTAKLSQGGSWTSTGEPPQQTSGSQRNDQTKLLGLDFYRDEDPETSPQSSTEAGNLHVPTTSHSDNPPLLFVTPRTFTNLMNWGSDGATMSSLPDPFLAEMRQNLMPKEDGSESLWTEAAKPGDADTAAPLSQDEATEATMSSVSLPLIFEPPEEATPEGRAAAAAAVTLAQPPGGGVAAEGTPPSEVDVEQLVTIETDGVNGPSRPPSGLAPEWTSTWQTSGAELPEPIGSSGPSESQRQAGRELDGSQEKAAVRTENLEENLPTIAPSLSSIQHARTTVTMETHHQAHTSRSGLEEMESEEEPDEDEDDENSEESVEEDSEEDLTEVPKASSTPPPYSLIPPPPVWVQRNQGLMRSWVELIREKAGYVSGMLAPVGIGITGALLIVGALYSIRMIHRKRRNSFKHQRRKVRQPEQPREPGTGRQDQAMLLADSSEDEF
ncbi:unnamed protein product [Ophioblennius macclurei]